MLWISEKHLSQTKHLLIQYSSDCQREKCIEKSIYKQNIESYHTFAKIINIYTERKHIFTKGKQQEQDKTIWKWILYREGINENLS